MDSEELLLEQARLYIRLSGDPGADPERIEKEFNRLRDLVIVEVYFMKTVRSIITREEMSGFILFIEKDLRHMIDMYDPSRSELPVFLRHCMELRALSYLAMTRRSRCLNSGRVLSRLAPEDGSEPGPEDILLMEEPPGETGTAVSRLRCICAARPSRRRNLFIFICTMLPSLTAGTVDNFCRILNIDRAQTGVIADYLSNAAGPVRMARRSRAYLTLRRNFFNMRRIELEDHLRTALDKRPLERQLAYQKAQLKMVAGRMAHTRMNVRYRIIAELLGLETRYIATSVYLAKKMLELANAGDLENYTGPFLKSLQLYEKKPSVEFRVFEPFAEFGITTLPEPPSESEPMLSPCRLVPANQLSSKHGTRQKNPSCKLQCAQAS